MPTLARWALAASFRFAKNDDDTPSNQELAGMQASFEDAFGKLVAQAFASYGIADTAQNRALVYLLSLPAQGSNKVMLNHGCRMFVHISNLPEQSGDELRSPAIADDE